MGLRVAGDGDVFLVAGDVAAGQHDDIASVDSDPAGARPMKTGLPSVSMPHAASTGSADAFA
jgi:hypothetical protein